MINMSNPTKSRDYDKNPTVLKEAHDNNPPVLEEAHVVDFIRDS